MTNQQKADKLCQAMELMEKAAVLVQAALGDSDSAQMTCETIGEVIEDLKYDIAELEGML